MYMYINIQDNLLLTPLGKTLLLPFDKNSHLKGELVKQELHMCICTPCLLDNIAVTSIKHIIQAQ
jgi:hypothetical protein